jgi:NAD(P)H-dependent FMN reductase
MMQNADAFIFVTPEYNGSYSPSMKNWLDHFPKDTYYRRTIGIVTGSTGAMGGMRATQQMQQLICALFGVPCPHMLVVPFMDKKMAENGDLVDSSFEGNVNKFVGEFLWQAKQLTK